MTRTTPWRRMILHFSHIGFTDGLTFMIPFASQEEPASTAEGCRAAPLQARSAEYPASEQDVA
jgi:hypothetical protein